MVVPEHVFEMASSLWQPPDEIERVLSSCRAEVYQGGDPIINRRRGTTLNSTQNYLDMGSTSLKGFEVMRALRKGQANPWCYDTGVLGEIRLIHRNFGLYAVHLSAATFDFVNSLQQRHSKPLRINRRDSF